MFVIGLCVPGGIAARQRDASTAATGPRASLAWWSPRTRIRNRFIERCRCRATRFRSALSAITDDAGRFDFAGLSPGRFTIAATRPGYVSIAYGATSPGRQGTALVVDENQQVTGLRLQLARGAVITGVVRDAKGDPVPGVDVLLRRRENDGTSVATSITVKTDDRGWYRMFGLMAGAYLVEALPRGPRGRTHPAPSDAEVDATLANLRSRRSGASLSIGTPPVASPPAPARGYRVVPIFYPSATAAADAVPVVVAAGEERGGVDITLHLVSPSPSKAPSSREGQPLPSVQLNLTTEASQGHFETNGIHSRSNRGAGQWSVGLTAIEIWRSEPGR